MQPDALSRIESDIQWLTETIGPRPAFSSAARLATLGVRDRLVKAGWTPKFVHLSNNLVACSGEGSVVLLAHTDTVPNSPGTLDNAVAVATLVDMARQHPTADLCVGFPAQEEIGLIGSKHLAEQIEDWHPNPEAIELVLSLDLVGHGTLSITGLNRQWNDNSLHTLLDITQIHSEYGYQVVSRLLPSMERSDHAPFAEAGFRSAQLLGRNEHGITPHYHTAADSSYQQEAVIVLEETLNQIIDIEWEPQESSPAGYLYGSATIGTTMFPWWAVWLSSISAIIVGIIQLRRVGLKLRSTLLSIPTSLLIGGIASIPALLSLLPNHPQEFDSLYLYGLSDSGWWNGALLFLPIVIGLAGWYQYKRLLIGNATGWMGLYTLGLLLVDPILALPWAIGTLFSRLHPFLAVIPIAYWMQPNILRELTTHGLLPPFAWGLLGLLCWPILLSTSKNND